MNKRFKLITLALIFAFGGYFAYDYIYKEHRDIAGEQSYLEISAPFLLERFKTNDGSSLLNATITVTGTVSQIEEQALTIDGSVYCNFDAAFKDVADGEPIIIKGRCIGYDDLFEVVKLDQCTIIK